MYSYYSQPSVAYCYSLSKLLTLFEANYSNTSLSTLIDNLSKRYADSDINFLFNSNSPYRDRVNRGYEISNLLLGTPATPILTWVLLEQFLEEIITDYLQIGDTITCTLKTGDKHTWELNSKDSWSYVYTYWLRKGFAVNEIKGSHLEVIEPLGKVYKLDSYRCSCEWAINNKKCIHLQLIEWFRQVKTYAISS